jgi:hypothetical protein
MPSVKKEPPGASEMVERIAAKLSRNPIKFVYRSWNISAGGFSSPAIYDEARIDLIIGV